MKPVLPVRVPKAAKPKHVAPGGKESAAKLIPAARVLKEFGAPEPAARNPEAEAEAGAWLTMKKPKAGAAIGMPSLLDDAYARGLEEGKAVAQADADVRFDEQKRFYEQQLELERCTWAAREADRLAARLDEGLENLKTALAEQTARLLKPFLIEQVQRQAVGELYAALSEALGADQGLKLEVSGPEDLLQLLREKLSGKPIDVEYRPAEGADVRVSVGQTILETRLAAWMAKLEEITK